MKADLYDCLVSQNCSDSNSEPANVVDGLYAIARSLNSVARAIRDLGNGDAATSMGAIENLAKEMRDGLGSISAAIMAK